MIIKNATVYTENDTVITNVRIKNGKITTIAHEGNYLEDVGEDVIDGTNLNLIPGFIDTHIHGANGADVMDASNEALDTMATYLCREGTTSFLATTITQSKQTIEAALAAIARYEQKPKQAELLGVHLEGPFVEKCKAGAQPAQHIIKPDIELFNNWQAIANGEIKTVTMAPEHDPNGRFIAALRQDGVNVSAGHTDGNYLEIKRATVQGLNQLTHLCNAMNGIHHRDVGAVGAAFLIDELKAEIIADGIHLSSEMLQIVHQNMGSERLILITDGMRAKGLPEGDYELGGQKVSVKDKRAILSDGTLAGSILNMVDGAKKLLTLPHVGIRDIIKMASENPARQIGVFDRKGSIREGKDADLLLVDDKLHIKYTLTHGSVAYKDKGECHS